jgi:hypothetical protein
LQQFKVVSIEGFMKADINNPPASTLETEHSLVAMVFEIVFANSLPLFLPSN